MNTVEPVNTIVLTDKKADIDEQSIYSNAFINPAFSGSTTAKPMEL